MVSEIGLIAQLLAAEIPPQSRRWRSSMTTAASAPQIVPGLVDVLGWLQGRPGRHRSGIAGPAARDEIGSIQPGAPAEGAAVARHHGRQSGLCRVRSNVAGPRWNAGNSADGG